MKKSLIASLKKELDVLSRNEKSTIKGGGPWVYGDGCCRPWYGQPPLNCNYPAGYSGPCSGGGGSGPYY